MISENASPEKPSYEALEKRVHLLEDELSQHKDALGKNHELHSLLRLMANNVPDMIWAKDVKDRYLFANQAICDNLLKSRSTIEPIGKTDLFFASREREKGFKHTFGEICVNSDTVVKKSGKPGRFLEDGLVRGEYMALDVYKAPFYDESGTMIGTVGCGRDVTKEIEINKALKHSERRFREIIEDMAEISIQGYDENRRVTFWNKASEKLYGYTEADALGKKLEDLIIPEDMRADVIGLHRQWLDHGIKIPAGELVLVDKKGNDVNVYSSHVMHVTPLGKEMFCIDVDLTRIKQAEKEKEALKAKLRQSQKIEAIGTLAGGIAHDFNNVLSPIMGLAELLLEDLPKNSLEYENASEIFYAGKRGSELVKQILSFARQSEHKKMPVKIQLILKEVIRLCRSAIPTDIEIQKDIRSDFGYILADPVQLHQVVMNLVTNAYQALENGPGKIAIALERRDVYTAASTDADIAPGQYALLSVSDTGGIDPAHQDKIFDPYFTTKENGKGTGLGLSTVYGIVKDHNGHIRIQNDAGKGATFLVYLPLMKDTADSTFKKESLQFPTGNERVLLVDDETVVANVEQQMLSRLGYQVTTVNSSLEGLRLIKADPDQFDLVLTDMTMPGMTGDQLASEILSLKPEMPIIICTGFSNRIDQEQVEKIGVKGLLMKPVTVHDMAEMVRKLLDES